MRALIRTAHRMLRLAADKAASGKNRRTCMRWGRVYYKYCLELPLDSCEPDLLGESVWVLLVVLHNQLMTATTSAAPAAVCKAASQHQVFLHGQTITTIPGRSL
jgi:hypothetical protein